MFRRKNLPSDADQLAELQDTLLTAVGMIAGVAEQHRAHLIRAGLPAHIADGLTMHAVSLMQVELLGSHT